MILWQLATMNSFYVTPHPFGRRQGSSQRSILHKRGSLSCTSWPCPAKNIVPSDLDCVSFSVHQYNCAPWHAYETQPCSEEGTNSWGLVIHLTLHLKDQKLRPLPWKCSKGNALLSGSLHMLLHMLGGRRQQLLWVSLPQGRGQRQHVLRVVCIRLTGCGRSRSKHGS